LLNPIDAESIFLVLPFDSAHYTYYTHYADLSQ